MKAMIGVGWFQKPDMIEWILSGIRENFPEGTHVSFYFEDNNYEDWAVYSKLVGVKGALEGFGSDADGAKGHILEHGVHRRFIERFMQTDFDVLIIPHDDNRFQRPLLPDLEMLWERYGENLGWIGGRDGHGDGYSNMVCSPFSQSTGAEKEVLPIGEYREVKMMNTGPVVYFRHVVEKVGLPDADMEWYWWSAMSMRCHNAGLTNILLSMDCLHEKFGRCGHNPDLYDDKLVADGLQKLRERFGPVL